MLAVGNVVFVDSTCVTLIEGQNRVGSVLLQQELITTLYSDVKVWYQKSRMMKEMREEDRSRCGSLQAQVVQLEGELSTTWTSRNRAHAQKIELASPLIITSQHAIDTWQKKTWYLQQCILGLGFLGAEEAEVVEHTPAVAVDEPAMDEAG